MSDVKDLSRKAVALKWLGDRIKAEQAAVKDALTQALGAGGRAHAITDSGADVGTVSVSMPTTPDPVPVVSDPARLVAWLDEHEPDAVVRTVAGWWEAALPTWIEVHDGELPPGVEVIVPQPKRPTVSVRISPRQEEALIREIGGMLPALIEGGDAQ